MDGQVWGKTGTYDKAFMMRCSTSFSGRVVCVATSEKAISLFPAGLRKIKSMRAMRQIFCRKKGACIWRMGYSQCGQACQFNCKSGRIRVKCGHTSFSNCGEMASNLPMAPSLKTKSVRWSQSYGGASKLTRMGCKSYEAEHQRDKQFEGLLHNSLETYKLSKVVNRFA